MQTERGSDIRGQAGLFFTINNTYIVCQPLCSEAHKLLSWPRAAAAMPDSIFLGAVAMVKKCPSGAPSQLMCPSPRAPRTADRPLAC